jgi:hypothetical protein
MKIAIVSDSHDNVPNIDKMLAYCKKEKVAVMLHCGDVCAPSVLKYLAENFTGEIYLVFGNVDGDRAKMEEFGEEFTDLNILGDEGSPKIKDLKLKIGMVHYPHRAKAMAKEGNYNFVFYGHNHRPWEETVNNTRLVNPGTLGGLFQKATFAVYDTVDDKLELKILERIN